MVRHCPFMCLRPFLSIQRSFAYIAECDVRAGYIPDSQAQAGKFNALIAERLLRAVSRFASETPDSPHLGGGRTGIGSITYSMHSQYNSPVYSQKTHSPNHALVIMWWAPHTSQRWNDIETFAMAPPQLYNGRST